MPVLSAKSAARRLVVGLALCFAASANAREVPQPLVQVWVTPKPLKNVEACVIKALDTDERTFSKISPSVRHVVKVRVPNSIVEIRPVKDHAVAEMDHYVRLEKIADVITRMALYSSDKSKQTMVKALTACGPD
jgi:hypothetical protein